MPRWVGLLLVCGVAGGAYAAEKPLPRVPAGFTIEMVAGADLVQHPMLAGFDDRGRLFVAESAGKNLPHTELLKDPPNFIRLLEDTDGDGRFDRSTIFADRMTLPMGALWYRGALYVASPPSIWRLVDTDGDGVADQREELVNTFGFSGNAASVHGCFLGPNGRIYWCDGRHGHEFRDEQGRIVSKGKAARIFSCRPDGSDVEVFCGGGMDNPVEVDFLPSGEMVGTVNILLSRPRVDCLMHWVEGGLYPRYDQEDCLAEFPRTGDLLPPMTRLGHVAVSGLCRYRSEAFGPEYRDNLFTAIFNTHRVIRSVVERSGATFRTKEEDFLVSDDVDFHPTDVLEDADGSLLVIDTGGWFRIGCPTSQVAKPEIAGAIYRIRREDAAALDDPRGLRLRLESRSAEELVRWLDDPRPAVRERVVDLLAQAGIDAVEPLARMAASGRENETGRRPASAGSVLARRNAVWALSRIESDQAVPALIAALNDADETVRLAAARSLGIRREAAAVDPLIERIASDTPSVKRNAATALGRIAEKGRSTLSDPERRRILAALFSIVSASGTDRILEHAAIYAAIRIDDREATIPFLKHANPNIRRAALIALDQMPDGRLTRELVVPLLDTDDPALVEQTLDVISRHEGWSAETLNLLRTWLAEKELPERRASILRGFLIARSAEPEIQELVARTLKQPASADLGLLLLEVVARSPLKSLPESWIAAVGKGLEGADPRVRLQAVSIIGSRGLSNFDEQLRRLLNDDAQSVELRLQALLALAPRLKSLEPAWFEFAVGRLSSGTPPLVRLLAARALEVAPLNDAQLQQLAGRLSEAGPLALPVLVRAFEKSDRADVGLSLVRALEQSPSLRAVGAEEVSSVLSRYPPDVRRAATGLLAQLRQGDAERRARLAELSPLTDGGDPGRGREVFFGRKAACSSCHTVEGQGGRVGPDLTKIGTIRNGTDLLEAVVFPSASFARGFRPYVIVTDEGRVHTGVISRETADAVYLRTAELAELRIPRESIEEISEASRSIMPDGLDRTLSADELRDLLAFLQERR